MYKLIFLRHGSTQGNIEGRYIGKTDEPLCAKGVTQLSYGQYPDVELVFSSPMLRCIQTAQLLYKDKTICILDGIKECDFGDFENKNYKELNGNADYQKWIDSNGTLPFPNGDDVGAFKNRCLTAFSLIVHIMSELEISNVAIITHGGVIMSILEAYSKEDFYDFQIKNGQGFAVLYERGKMLEIKRM